MASPLTMYVQIKQEAFYQELAEGAVKKFAAGVKAGLDATGIVHYATLALVPNMPEEPGKAPVGYAGILLMTNFDLAMDPYLETFWDATGGGIKTALQGIAAIAYNPAPPIENVNDFVNFINKANLTPAPEDGNWLNFYQAYGFTVAQINS
jgi:hypothetical protein